MDDREVDRPRTHKNPDSSELVSHHKWGLVLGSRFELFYGEFDPGSERTLAAGLTHASRARKRGNP